MGALTARDKGVLKLVHPGRHVEIHTEPITAAEVMEKNPRHLITRPDVFKNPWIVVKPESELRLGKVYFIVPCQTIYKLLKAQGHCSQSLQDHVHVHQQLQQASPIKSDAGMTPKHQIPNHNLCLGSQHGTKSWLGTNIQEQGCDGRIETESEFESSPDQVIAKFKEKSLVDSVFDIISYHDKYYNYNDGDISPEFHIKENGDLESKCTTASTALKSCIRKQDSARKSLNLRVSFVLPTKDEEQQKRIRGSPMDSCGLPSFNVHSSRLLTT